MILDEESWSISVTWRRLCHEHDDIVPFMEGKDRDAAGWMCRKWMPPPVGTLNLCVDDSFRDDVGCIG